jgi:Histidine kinase-, DNA gyrase B-, and HSP90-like ATPase
LLDQAAKLRGCYTGMGFGMQLPKFTMEFQPRTIEHLGLRLYSTLPPVVSELVSNAYDAESPKVEVVLPSGDIGPDSEVIVRDYGHSMDANEIQTEYLPIGRNRRGDDSNNQKSKHGKRTVTGRKGLGKLSAFGVAEELEVRSIKNGVAIAIKLNYAEMQRWAKKKGSAPYEPTVIASRTGRTRDADGVEITIRGLHRRNRISIDVVRRGLARRLSFIGHNFRVLVNGQAIQPGDRISMSDCEPDQRWKVEDLPQGDHFSNGLQVTGWIGFLSTSSQSNRGIDIYANGKAAELDSYFNYPSTHAQFARAHIVGEIHADFLDDTSHDLIATPRNSVLWEDPSALALQDWGHRTLQWAFDKWVEIRREKKSKEIIRAAAFDVWLAQRQPHEQKVAMRMVKLLADDEALDPNSVTPLLEIIKGSVESAAFLELINTLDATRSINAAQLLQLFAEWRVVEARDMLRLADGRRAAIDQLETYMRVGALEVAQMQPLLRSNIWLLNPRWNEPQVEQTYTELLKRHCKESKGVPEVDRRIDIMGVSEGSVLTVVEIKRPEKTLERKDLEQIEQYVDWANANIVGSGPESFRIVNGLLVVGKLSGKAELREKIRRLAGHDIRVETYADLHSASKKYYAKMDRRLKEVAPEYARDARRNMNKKKAKAA